MNKRMRRLTISVPAAMEYELNEIKQRKYSKSSKSEMIRDLISRGINSVEGSADSCAKK